MPRCCRFFVSPRREERACPQRSVSDEQRRRDEKRAQPRGRAGFGLSGVACSSQVAADMLVVRALPLSANRARAARLSLLRLSGVKRRLVLLGAPGSGKGTQAEMITRQFGIPVTSPGAILRRERDLGTPLGMETAEITQRGGLVSDEIIVKLIEDWLRLHGAHGFVFDGFPRTLPQAQSLDAILKRLRTALDLAIWLEVSEQTVRDRISG